MSGTVAAELPGPTAEGQAVRLWAGGGQPGAGSGALGRRVQEAEEKAGQGLGICLRRLWVWENGGIPEGEAAQVPPF